MKDPKRVWSRLVEAARQEPVSLPEIPPGFATRVVALSRAPDRGTGFPAFVWRAVAVAALVAGISTTLQVRSWYNSVESEIALFDSAEAETDAEVS